LSAKADVVNLGRALLVLGGLAWCLVPGAVAAQDAQDAPEGPTEAVGDAGDALEAGQPVLDIASEDGEGLEAAISGADYRLGPGDVLAISIWGPQPLAYRLAVTLEGNLLIPQVGEIAVNTQKLEDAKTRITEAILRVYRNVEVTVTLTRLRRFQIHVLGQVRSPGTYTATAVNRVSYAVARARGFTKDASQRRILVQTRTDSLRTEADLFSFLKRGDLSHNPYLRDGDKVYVPFSHERFQVVGQVNDPGSIQFLPGDRLSDALRLAGGFTQAAFVDTLEVARYTPGAAEPIRFQVVAGGGFVAPSPQGLPEILGTYTPDPDIVPPGAHPEYPDFELQPDDIIFVRSYPQFRLRRLVEIQGEVRYPGAYPYVDGQTRLSDLVEMAGGLTGEATLIGAKLIRREKVGLTDPEFERLKKMNPADMDKEEYAYFKAKSREVRGEMVVDFSRALENHDPDENVLLYRGDLVVIPLRKNFVNVLGMVEKPGNVLYRPGLRAKDYINRAGGYAEDASKGKSRVIPAAGGAWMRLGEAGALDPGDVVFVPEKPERDLWKIFRDGLTVTAQILTVYLVVDRALQ